MTVEARCADDDERETIEVDVSRRQGDRPTITLGFAEREYFTLALDENHAQALVLALQAAIAEVQARAVSL